MRDALIAHAKSSGSGDRSGDLVRAARARRWGDRI